MTSLKVNNKTIDKHNGWSTKKEKILQLWMDECNIYSKLYSYNVVWYEKIDKTLGIISILLSAITGASLLNNGGSSDTSSNNIVIIIYIFGSLSMLNTFIQATKEFLNLKNIINSNLIAARQNKMICLDIEAQLNLSRNERKHGKEFLITIKDRKNDLVLNGPVVSERIWKRLRLENGKSRTHTAIDNYFENERALTLNSNSGSDDDSSDKRLYKRRPTISYLHMKNKMASTKEMENNPNINISKKMNKNISFSGIDELTFNNETSDAYSINDDTVSTMVERKINDITVISPASKKNNIIDNISLSNINIDSFEYNSNYYSDNTNLSTDEENEDTFINDISNNNKACNLLKQKLQAKPINELKHELGRYNVV